MTDEIRLAEIKKLYRACFSDNESCTDFMFERKLGLHNCFYIVLGGKLVSMLFLVPKQLFYCRKIINLPYIVAVSTDEKYRHRGFARQNIKNTLESIYPDTPFVMLYPDVRGFYKKLGFETISFDHLPADLKKRAPRDDGELCSLYEEYTENLDFYIVREEKSFAERRRELAFDGSTFEVLTVLGKSVGYVSSEENLIFDGNESGYKKGAMARIVNLEKAFTLTEITLKFGIRVVDSLLEENNITFSVKKGRIIRQEKYRYTLDISELTALLFGVSENRRLQRYFPKLKGRILDRY